jgi:hypothetical protein
MDPGRPGVWFVSFQGNDMTERKPPGANVGSWIEAQIGAAMQQGAFDNLPGAGKPLPNSGRGYDPDRWIKQMLEREGAAIAPPSLELRRQVEKELAAIGTLDDEAAVRLRIAALNAQIARFNATAVEGPPTNLATFDIDQVVTRWRQSRAAR